MFTPHLKQLRVFSAVLSTGGTRQAADALNMSQPGVSMLLRDLEANVGFKLFVRRSGKLVPTPEADRFIVRVTEALNSMDRLSSFANDIREIRTGSVRVASLVGPSLNALPCAIAKFTANYPGVRVALQTRTSGVIRNWVRDDVLDIGVSESHFDENVKVLERFEMECVLALPKGHRLSKKNIVCPTDLIGEKIIALNPDHQTSAQLRDAFAQFKRSFEPDIETFLFGPLAAMVAAGAGVGIIDPLSANTVQNAGLVIRKFRPKIVFRLMVITSGHQQMTRHTSELVKYISKELDLQVNETLSKI